MTLSDFSAKWKTTVHIVNALGARVCLLNAELERLQKHADAAGKQRAAEHANAAALKAQEELREMQRQP
jgi:uncharacterized small protein (DUF1192 family)